MYIKADKFQQGRTNNGVAPPLLSRYLPLRHMLAMPEQVRYERRMKACIVGTRSTAVDTYVFRMILRCTSARETE